MTARVAWTELEIPEELQLARVAWAELEIPASAGTSDPYNDAWGGVASPTTAKVAWTELEVPAAPVPGSGQGGSTATVRVSSTGSGMKRTSGGSGTVPKVTATGAGFRTPENILGNSIVRVNHTLRVSDGNITAFFVSGQTISQSNPFSKMLVRTGFATDGGNPATPL